MFTRAEALAAGVSVERLRRRDIVRVSRGRYRWRGPRTEPAATTQSGPAGPEIGSTEAGPVHRSLPLASTVLAAVPDSCASHTTAALLRSWWLPEQWVSPPTVHVIRPASRSRLERRPVVTHFSDVLDEDIVRIHGRRVTSVERTWLDCASLLTLTELVMLGDSLVRVPRAWAESRSEPSTTVQRLRDGVGRYAGLSGITRAREALGLIRTSSDSPKESQFRLAMLRAGLPEPTLQVECWDPEYSAHFPATADLGYPGWKIALQYEGEHHGNTEQLKRDLRRDQAFIRQGWTVLRFGADDAREGFRGAIGLVRRAIRTVAA